MFQAGVARAEITPPPGLALFGHGPEGRVSRGRRTRLYCRAFVLTKGESAIALLPCDLSEVSLELAREIANRTVGATGISADRIILSATHAHGGPAHFFGSGNYHGPLSSRAYGFDGDVLDWLADRAAKAIIAAFDSRRSARASWKRRELCGLTRNRSFVPFDKNDLDGVQDQLTCSSPYRERRAIDSSLFTLTIETLTDSDEWRRAGTYSVFGVHGTVVPNTNDLYEGDLFAFAERALEQSGEAAGARCLDLRMRDDECDFAVAGIANGIEGDVSPMYERQAMVEAQRIGVELARAIRTTTTSGGSRDPELRAIYRELYLPSAADGALCDHPAIGVAAGGGTEDGQTTLKIFPMANEGAALARGDNCHSPKVPLYTAGETTTEQLPGIAPVLLVRIGDALLTSVPFEPTTVAGLRIRKALARVHDAEVDLFPIVALANSYLQYLATYEEYQLQHYEGASTLYGAESAAFFAENLSCLAQALQGEVATCHGAYPIGAIVTQYYSPDPVVDRLEPERECPTKKFEASSLTVTATTVDAQPGWSFRFHAHEPRNSACWQDLHLEILDDGGRVIADDVRDDFELRHEMEGPAWNATWFPEKRVHGNHRFRIRIGELWSIESRPFCSEACR